MTEKGFDCEQARVEPNYTEQKYSQGDRASGETSETKHMNNELVSEENKMERRHSFDKISDEYPQRGTIQDEAFDQYKSFK